VSRFRRALAVATLAAAAAGGALLTSAAGAAPAYAASTAAPAGGHTIQVTATQRPGGIGSRDILPCVIPASASTSQVKPAACGAQTITCEITVPPPALTSFRSIVAGASVHCDAPVASIQLNELLEKNGGAGGPLDQDQDNVVNDANAHTATAGGACVASREYDNAAWAVVNFPSGYTPTTGSLHGNASLTPTASACAPPPPPGGGGGGGGCAVTAPSPVAQPPADRSRLISCQ